MRDGIPRDPKTIVFLRFGGIGEILAITPALAAIREAWPSARIVGMVPEKAREILDRLGVVDEYLFADWVYAADGAKDVLHPRALGQLAVVRRALRSRDVDLLLVFNHLYYWRSVLKPALISWLSRAPVRVGFDSYRRGFFLTHRVPDRRLERRHLVYRNKEFLEALGLPVPELRPRMSLHAEDFAEASRVLAGRGIAPGAAYFACNPGSSRPATRWFPDRFAETVRTMAHRFAMTPVLIGRAGEEGLCAEVIRRAGVGVGVAGETSLHGLAALLKGARVLISNDTGSIHVAVAVGTPVVGIYRPGEVPLWGSYDLPNFRAVYRPVECAPCLRWSCGHHTCMRLIEPADVVAAAREAVDA